MEQSQADALPHTTVITSEQIRQRNVQDLHALLRQEAGIQITQNGGVGQSSSLFIRGATPAEVLILVDGVPVRRQGFAASPALEHILPEQIERVEIVRGNVSAIYGSGAIGGVVQIFTKEGSDVPSYGVSTEIGSHGTRRISGAASGKFEGTRYAVSATRLTSEGFSSTEHGQYANENPDKDGYRNTSVSGTLSHEWAKGQQFGLRAYANEGKVDFDGGGFAPTLNERDWGQSAQRTVALFSKNRFAANWQSTLTLSETMARNDSRSTGFGGSVIRDESNTSSLQWNNEIGLGADWTLVAGLDGRRERLDAYSDFGFGATRAAYSRQAASVYSGIVGGYGAHQFQANLRRDRVDGAGSDTTGYLGYGYAITPTVKLIASTSTAFNAPTLTQINDPVSGNQNLRSERSKSHEIGAQYASGTNLIRMTLFRTRIRDQFATDPNNCTFLVCPTVNLARTLNQGVELSASGSLHGIDLSASLTRQSPRDEATNAILLRRVRTSASVAASKTWGAWRTGMDLSYAGKRPDRDFVAVPVANVTLPSYWLANANIRYQASKQTSVHARIENIFDRRYQQTYGYRQPPRGIYVGLNWQQ